MNEAGARPPERAARGRFRVWLAGAAALVVAVLVLRAVVSARLAPELAARLTGAIDGRVTIGDVDLSILGGAVTLHDVAVEPSGPDPKPCATVERIDVRVHVASLWPVVFSSPPDGAATIRVASIELLHPTVELEREPDGTWNVLHLLPRRAPEEAGGAPGAAGVPRIAIDRVEAVDGRLAFRDLAAGAPEPLQVAFDRIEVDRIAFAEGAYDEPLAIRLHARLGDGALDAEATVRGTGDALDLAGSLRAEALPLDRMRVYVPRVGWSALHGRLGGGIAFGYRAGGAQSATGDLRIDGLEIATPGLEPPALAIGTLALTGGEVDLAARRISVRALALDRASLVVAPGAPALLPLLPAAGDGADPAGRSAATAKSKPSGRAEAPWRWAVSRIDVAGSQLVVLLPQGRMDVEIAGSAQPLSGDRAAVTALDVKLQHDGGSVGARGALRLDPVGFDGALALDGVALGGTLAPFAPEAAALVSGGAVDGTVDVATNAGSGDVTLSGKLAVADLAVASEQPEIFTARFPRLEVALRSAVLPGATRGGDGRAQPARVALGDVRAQEPELVLTREAEGFVLPRLPEGKGDGPSPRITIDALELTRGRVRFTDRTVRPFYRTALTDVAVVLGQIELPEAHVRSIAGTARTAFRGAVDLKGHADANGLVLVIDAKQLALASFNPYAAAAGYGITRGDGDLVSSLWYGEKGFEAKNWLTLRDLRLGGMRGESLFLQQFGIPLDLALALLRDASGSISLTVPLWRDAGNLAVRSGEAVRSALRQALVGALASPLKLVGAVIPGGDGDELVPPPPIPFPAGQDEMWEEGYAALNQLAQLLVESPAVRVELEGVSGPADLRWLREQALLERIEREDGVLGRLRRLPDPAAREAVAWLRERRAGAPPPLDGPAARWLDERLAGVEVDPARLSALAAARGERVHSRLERDWGVSGDRVDVGGSRVGLADAVAPEVTIRLLPR